MQKIVLNYNAWPQEGSSAELGTRQFCSFATMTTRQRNNATTRQCNIASGTSQGPEKNRKIVRPQCLDGVATQNIVKRQLQTTLWPDYMVTLLRQNCRLPRSAPQYPTESAALLNVKFSPL